jgi:Polyketide cyclase / dehydrase and lipid transport
MELALEHLDVQPPSRLTMREEDEVSIFNVEYRLESAQAGTRFTQTSEFEWKSLPRILHGTFARGVGRDVRGQLQALKRLLER